MSPSVELKKIGGMEFYDVMFSYIDKETLKEYYVSVQGKLIPETRATQDMSMSKETT